MSLHVPEVIQQWQRGPGALGVWCNLPELHMAETAARSGAQWLCFDLQHGLMDYSDLLRLMPAVTGTDITVLVRVAMNSPDQIGRALDAGADGVIVPMVNSAEEAAAAAAACRYPPAGNRSCGPMRHAMLEGLAYLGSANDRVLCFPMIETREGVENVEAIANTAGVTGLFVGPMDLCFGLGVPPGDFNNQTFTDAVGDILRCSHSAGIAPGMFGYTAELARAALDEGFVFASIGSDISFYRAGLQQAMRAAAGTDADVKSAGY